MSAQSSFVDLCIEELTLCGVKEGETVAVLSQLDERIDYADAFMAAAVKLGATTYNVRLPEASTGLLGDSGAWTVGATPLAGNQAAMDSLKRADLVIDLMFLLFSKEQLEIQEAGARMLLCVEPIDNLSRLFPTSDQRRRVEVSEELIAKASTLRFTNAAGSDVTYKIGSYPVMTEYGYTDQPGRWDHWPAGFLFTGGADDGVDGKVVVDRGDIIITPFKKFVDEPVEITISSGRIDDIRGGSDAELLRDYIGGFDDEKAYGISHIGWGCNEKARWSGLANDRRSIGMESRAFYGNTLFSTGPNQELGGDNDTQCHIDIPMRNCSVWLDDEPVIVDGEFVIDDLKAQRTTFAPPSQSRN
ncbi:MAG: 2,5-dihydroxypyridine 5,6-dioxygenase [Solirubrobacterales bacterium]|nr:2,5-dihydroxypyridine 5,6-dioxygenase [Solirubrobacterales bacterium]